jgi:peptidoglycan-associated lipoprotein
MFATTKKLAVLSFVAVTAAACATQKPQARIEVDDTVPAKTAVAQTTPAPAKSDDAFVGGTVRFAYNSYVLEPDAVADLDELSDKLRADQTAEIVIEGHTDDIGSDAFNLALGEARARSVRNYLVKRGVPASRISTISYGEERPSAEGTDEGARAANRRGELVLK